MQIQFPASSFSAMLELGSMSFCESRVPRTFVPCLAWSAGEMSSDILLTLDRPGLAIVEP